MKTAEELSLDIGTRFAAYFAGDLRWSQASKLAIELVRAYSEQVKEECVKNVLRWAGEECENDARRYALVIKNTILP